MGGSSKRECLDPKKCLDPKTIIRERCEVCIKKYNAANRALNRKKKKDLIKETRSVVDKKDLYIRKFFVIYVKKNKLKNFALTVKISMIVLNVIRVIETKLKLLKKTTDQL